MTTSLIYSIVSCLNDIYSFGKWYTYYGIFYCYVASGNFDSSSDMADIIDNNNLDLLYIHIHFDTWDESKELHWAKCKQPRSSHHLLINFLHVNGNYPTIYGWHFQKGLKYIFTWKNIVILLCQHFYAINLLLSKKRKNCETSFHSCIVWIIVIDRKSKGLETAEFNIYRHTAISITFTTKQFLSIIVIFQFN